MVSVKDVLIAMQEKELPLSKTCQSRAKFQEEKKCHCFFRGRRLFSKYKYGKIAHCVNVCIRDIFR